MKLLSFIKSFGKLKAAPPKERLQCARCHRIAYSPLDRAQHKHYTPYCSDSCKAWAEIDGEAA